MSDFFKPVGVRAALIGAIALIVATLIQVAYSNSQNKEDAELLRKMVIEYAKCGCSITIPKPPPSQTAPNALSQSPEEAFKKRALQAINGGKVSVTVESNSPTSMSVRVLPAKGGD